MKLKHIPNILSIIRILLVFVFVYVFYGLNRPILAIVVFLVAGATDVVDGYLARRFNWITNLGKILDPFADKLMQCTVLICFCQAGIIPLWFVIPFFAKEAATLILGFIVIKRRSVVIVSKWYGKAAVCLFYVTIVISIVCRSFFDAHPIIKILAFAPAVIFALAAMAAYVKHYSKLKKKEIAKGTIREVIK